MTPGAEIELGPHWWKASALTSRPTLPRNEIILLIGRLHNNRGPAGDLSLTLTVYCEKQEHQTDKKKQETVSFTVIKTEIYLSLTLSTRDFKAIT